MYTLLDKSPILMSGELLQYNGRMIAETKD
jgi:hypothetical protein